MNDELPDETQPQEGQRFTGKIFGVQTLEPEQEKIVPATSALTPDEKKMVLVLSGRTQPRPGETTQYVFLDCAKDAVDALAEKYRALLQKMKTEKHLSSIPDVVVADLPEGFKRVEIALDENQQRELRLLKMALNPPFGVRFSV